MIRIVWLDAAEMISAGKLSSWCKIPSRGFLFYHLRKDPGKPFLVINKSAFVSFRAD
jgi:hypothetical protein